MAITAAAAGTANSTTSTATLAITTTATINVGEFIVVAIAADNAGAAGATSTISVEDTAGNTYVLRADRLQDPGAASAGTSLRVFCAEARSALASGQTITVNFSPNTTSKGAAVWRVVPSTGMGINFLVETGNVGTGANPSVTSATVTSGDLVIGVTAAETSTTPTADSDTSNGSWSTAQVAVANSGSGVTSQVVTTQYKVVTGTATQTYNTTLISLDRAISILTFSEFARVVPRVVRVRPPRGDQAPVVGYTRFSPPQRHIEVIPDDRVTARNHSVVTVPLSTVKPRGSYSRMLSGDPIAHTVERGLVVTIPRPLSAPRVITRTLTPALRTEVVVVVDRVTPRATVIPPRPLASPPTVTLARPIWRTFVAPVVDRVTPRVLTASTRPLPAPTVTTTALRQRLDTDAFEKLVATRATAITVPTPIPAARVATARPIWRTVVAAAEPERVVNRVRVVIVPMSRAVPRGISAGAIGTGDVAAVETRYVRRIFRSVNTFRPAPPTLVVIDRSLGEVEAEPETTLTAPVQATLVTVPSPAVASQPKIVQLTARSRFVAPVVDRVTNRVTVIPPGATPVARVSYRALRQRLDTDAFQKPVARRGLVVTVPLPLRAPATNLARSIWLTVPAAAPAERATPRALIISIPTPLAPPAVTIRLLRLRLDTDRFQRRVATRLRIAPSAPPKVSRSTWHVPAPNTETQTSGRQRGRCIRIPLRPTLPVVRALADSPFRPATSAPTTLAASGQGDWAWDSDGSATTTVVSPAVARSRIIGFDENVGRPKHMKGE